MKKKLDIRFARSDSGDIKVYKGAERVGTIYRDTYVLAESPWYYEGDNIQLRSWSRVGIQRLVKKHCNS